MQRIFALLGGGKASRLGHIEKLNLDFYGITLADLIIERFENTGWFSRLILLCGKKDPEVFSLKRNVDFVKDEIFNQGPIGGIYALLKNIRPEDAFFLHAGDMPFSSITLAGALKEKFEEGYDVVVAESKKGVEPLFGWYRGTVKSAVEKALSSGKRQIISFYDDVSVYIMPLSEVQEYSDPDTCFFNVNTEEDYGEALNIFKVISGEKKDQKI